MDTVLTRRQLNRSLLARQLLLERVDMPALDAVEHLVGVQAQEPPVPYHALWNRLRGFRASELSTAIEERRAVRGPLLRATLHLVTARDHRRMRPVVQPVLERVFQTQSPFGRRIADLDRETLLAEGVRLVEEAPRTRSELRGLLGARWPDGDAEAMAQAVTYLVPAVQVTPRGLWKRSGAATWTTARRWLGRAQVGSAGKPDDLVLRYLAAYGPATPADVTTWSGLAATAGVLDRLRPRLRTFRDESGRELFDVPDAPFPDPDVPAGPRFVPIYDNALLSHRDRSRIGSEEHRSMFFEGALPFLLDGFVAGSWVLHRGAPMLTVRPFGRLSPGDRDALTEEALALLAFLEVPGPPDVRFERPA
jgi:hypothetical protein